MCSLYVTYSYYLSSLYIYIYIYISTVLQHLQILATPLATSLYEIIQLNVTVKWQEVKQSLIFVTRLSSRAVYCHTSEVAVL